MTHRSWFQSQNCLQLPTNIKKRIVCKFKKGEKIIKNNCNDLTKFFVCFLHIISYKNVQDLSKKIVKMSWTFFIKIEVLAQIVRIIWCNLWWHIKHCVTAKFCNLNCRAVLWLVERKVYNFCRMIIRQCNVKKLNVIG